MDEYPVAGFNGSLAIDGNPRQSPSVEMLCTPRLRSRQKRGFIQFGIEQLCKFTLQRIATGRRGGREPGPLDHRPVRDEAVSYSIVADRFPRVDRVPPARNLAFAWL